MHPQQPVTAISPNEQIERYDTAEVLRLIRHNHALQWMVFKLASDGTKWATILATVTALCSE